MYYVQFSASRPLLLPDFIDNRFPDKEDERGDYPSKDPQEHKCYLVEAEYNGIFRPELLRRLVRPIPPKSLSHATLVKLVQPVVQELRIFWISLYSPACLGVDLLIYPVVLWMGES